MARPKSLAGKRGSIFLPNCLYPSLWRILDLSWKLAKPFPLPKVLHPSKWRKLIRVDIVWTLEHRDRQNFSSFFYLNEDP